MEILYRRFGKNGLEEKVNAFMALVRHLSNAEAAGVCLLSQRVSTRASRGAQDTDEDDEQSIGFAEYMIGINRVSAIPDPGFKISQVRD